MAKGVVAFVFRWTTTNSQTYRVDFVARNNTATSMTVQAIPGITPVQGTDYLIETRYFCLPAAT